MEEEIVKLKLIDTLVIDRSKWVAGGINSGLKAKTHPKVGYGITKLLNTKKEMCCLGFMCAAMGAPLESMDGIALPAALGRIGFEIPLLINSSGDNSNFCSGAARINDDKDLTLKEREDALISYFAKENITVTFIGEYIAQN